jgi:hypothetical protein
MVMEAHQKDKFPIQRKIITQMILESKVPMWDNLQKRQFQGLGLLS